MLLMEPNETRYDLRWRMFGIPVRVHPLFWLVGLFMGAGAFRLGVQYLATWIGCLFVSILVHEFGHIWMGQAFGSKGHIVLYSFGGLAIGSNRLQHRWERIAVSFAGPLAGFVFLALLLLGLYIWDADTFPYFLLATLLDLGVPPETAAEWLIVREVPSRMMAFTVLNLIFINLIWGLVNLLPVWPLDGGQISKELCEALWPESGLTTSLGISLVVAGLLTLHCVLVVMGRQLIPIPIGSTYTAIVFGILAFQSFQLLQQAQSQERWRDDSWDER